MSLMLFLINFVKICLINRKLDQYYSSQDWFSDAEDSNNNLLPEDLKCGVLSEDGAYNLFGENHELAIRMVEIAAKMLRRE